MRITALKTVFNVILILPHILYIPKINLKRKKKKPLNFLKRYRYTTKHITLQLYNVGLHEDEPV